jgi:hypothetical protein
MVFAVACVLASSALHVLAGGAPIRPGFLAGALALTWAGAFLLGGRQRGLPVLLGAGFAAQYGMHHLFTAGAEASVPALGHEHGSGLGSALGMILVHAVVSVVSAWWLERGESALATILHLVAACLGAVWAGILIRASLVVEARLPRRPVASHRVDRLTRLFLAAGVSRRGPPLPVSVL